MEQEHDHFKAGLFVIAGIVLAILIIFTLADLNRLFEQQQMIQVYYPLDEGLQGLKEGAIVTLGDQPIGSVTLIEDKIEESEDGALRVVGKMITASIPERYDIFRNAIIELKAPLIGSGTWLNIRSVGEESPYTESTPITGRIAGSTQVQELIRETGIGSEQRQQIGNIIANVEAVTAVLRDDLPAITQTANQMMSNANTAANDLKETAIKLRHVTDHIEQRSADWVNRIDRMTLSAEQALASAQNLVQDKDAALRQSVDNVYQVTQTLRDKTVVQITGALDQAIVAIENFRQTSDHLKTFVVGQRPILELALANAKLTTDQLKLAAIEIRRQPWRLLYQPDDEEVHADNLYDAARSFALAASTLQATAQSLQTLSGDQTVNPQQVKNTLDYLESVFTKFEDAEAVFWDALKNTSTKPHPR